MDFACPHVECAVIISDLVYFEYIESKFRLNVVFTKKNVCDKLKCFQRGALARESIISALGTTSGSPILGLHAYIPLVTSARGYVSSSSSMLVDMMSPLIT
jgi:hypothetical protein